MKNIIEFDVIGICSEIIVKKLNFYMNKDGLEYEKLRLGVDVVVLSVSKIILTLILAIYFNIFFEVLLMSVVHGVVRYNAFGLHAKNSNVCLVLTLAMFILPPILLKSVYLDNYTVLIVFILFSLLLYKYAPADTESHPLLGATLRKKLKMRTLVYSFIVMILTLLIPFEDFKIFPIISTMYVIIGILPITYNIFKRRYKNYEKYE